MFKKIGIIGKFDFFVCKPNFKKIFLFLQQTGQENKKKRKYIFLLRQIRILKGDF